MCVCVVCVVYVCVVCVCCVCVVCVCVVCVLCVCVLCVCACVCVVCVCRVCVCVCVCVACLMHVCMCNQLTCGNSASSAIFLKSSTVLEVSSARLLSPSSYTTCEQSVCHEPGLCLRTENRFVFKWIAPKCSLK